MAEAADKGVMSYAGTFDVTPTPQTNPYAGNWTGVSNTWSGTYGQSGITTISWAIDARGVISGTFSNTTFGIANVTGMCDSYNNVGFIYQYPNQPLAIGGGTYSYSNPSLNLYFANQVNSSTVITNASFTVSR